MELAYLPDSISFISGRRLYRPQEESWINVNSYNSNNNFRNCYEMKINEKNCQICKEKRKKGLSNYIRNKLRRDSEPMTHIREEDEETSKVNCDADDGRNEKIV